jgi:hypothetical protein
VTQAIANTNSAGVVEQPWLSSALWDSLLIISPAFITSAIAIAFRSQLDNSQDMPLWAWVSFVLVVDVAHVYATLFRTYFDPKSFNEHKPLLLLIPFICWAVGWALYSYDDILFWRALAYLAVFHFIRQQYGFVALYARKDPTEFSKFKLLDKICVYVVTLFPLIYWHTHLPRNFSWFVKGDFVSWVPAAIIDRAFIAYAVVGISYLIKEIFLFKKSGFFNIPKNLIVIGTALSWWVGIIALNSDIAFTMTNVVTHGIPYMALVWLYHNRTGTIDGATVARSFSEQSGAKRDYLKLARDILLSFAPAFVLFLIILAYIEEGFWDGLVWREHLTFFSPFAQLPAVTEGALLAVLVPLLSLPQSTHYVLDGFIWRVKDKVSSWSAVR